MSGKEIYIAVVWDKFGDQLIRYAFEHPTIEYWAEHKEQQKLKKYFEKYHYTHDKPIVIEKADILDFMSYKGDGDAK